MQLLDSISFECASIEPQFKSNSFDNIAPALYTQPLEALIAQQGDISRATVEAFIKQGFQQVHQASIHSFMPSLMYLRKYGLIQSALGVRVCSENTFLAQYFDQPLAQVLNHSGFQVELQDCVEIGNLRSISNTYTQHLFLMAVLALSLRNKSVMLFTAIPPVTNILNKHNIPYIELAAADESRVSGGPDSWGSYYENKPMVMAVRIDDVISCIAESKPLSALSLTFDGLIQQLTEQLEDAGV